jgi:ATP-dependent RNA helicase SUPV3L1/SUV3
LTERFVNRRTTVLMKKLGPDAALLPVRLDGEEVLVDEEHIGTLQGFRFQVDPSARHADHKLLLAAAERHVPALLGERARTLAGAIAGGEAELALRKGAIHWEGQRLAKLERGRSILSPQLKPDAAVEGLPAATRKPLLAALEGWLDRALKPLDSLRRLDAASTAPEAGPELRALLIRLVDAGGMIERAGSGIDSLDKLQRNRLAKLGVRVGALDLFVPAMLRPAALEAWRELAALDARRPTLPPPDPAMPPTLAAGGRGRPPGYRSVGKQWLRLDIAEKLLREAHAARIAAGHASFALEPARAISMGLTTQSYSRLLGLGGFQPIMPRPLAPGAFGPPAPLAWRWRPRRQVEPPPASARRDNAFAALAELVR